MRLSRFGTSAIDRPRVFALLTGGLLAAAVTAGCTTQAATSESGESSTSAGQSSGTASAPLTVEEAMESNHDYWTSDSVGQGEAESISLEGTTASSASGAVTVSENTVTISSAGRYSIKGALQGQVIVDAGEEAEVTVVLEGATIQNESGPALLISSGEGVIVELAEGSQNSLSDVATYSEDAEENAALFSHSDLQIAGSGSLEVDGNGADGIVSKDDLVITDGVITVAAVDDGIRGKDALVVTGGTIDVQAGGDAFKTTNEDEADRGYFLITGGSATLAAGSDGVDAITDALFNGGSVVVSQAEEGVEAQNVIIGDGNLEVTASDDGLNATIGSTTGTAATGATEETQQASPTPDAMQSGQIPTDGQMPMREPGQMQGPAPEGMQAPGGGQPPNGGAGQGEMPSDAMSGGDRAGGMGGGMGGGQGTGDGSSLVIYGGTTVLDVGGDGVDSNGTLTISGGSLTVFATDQGGNGAFDADGTFTLSGGTVLALSAGQMEQTPSVVEQAFIESNLSGQANSQVSATTAQGEAVSVQAPRNFGYIFFSSPDLVDGENATLAVGSEETEVAATTTSAAGGGFPGGGRDAADQNATLPGQSPSSPSEVGSQTGSSDLTET